MCKVNRTYGVELEGYVNEDLEGYNRQGWDLIEDGSLGGGDSECNTCDGRGEIREDCEECGGHGYENCGECGGTQRLDCTYCDGSGREECTTCDGSGRDLFGDEEGYCEDCDGNGHIDCVECSGDGYYECTDCDSDGEVSCSCCGGERSQDVECPECDGRGGGESWGVECVSPILNHGEYDSIDSIFNYIEGYSWNVNSDCGTHVHVGGKDLDVLALRNLALLSNIVEPVIYGMIDGDRYTNNYCKPQRIDFINRLLDKGDDIELWELCNLYYDTNRFDNDEDCLDMDEYDKYESERYYGLNLHSWFLRRTIEFRYFNGCDYKEDVKKWVDLCVKLVEFAKHTTLEQILVIAHDFYKVDSLHKNAEMLTELLGLESNIRAHSNYTYDRCRRNIVTRFRYVASAEELAS
jgi:hypothetical protein